MSISPRQETKMSADGHAPTAIRVPAPKRGLMELLLAQAPAQDLPLPDRKPLRRQPF